MKTCSVLAFAALLSAASPEGDVRREQQYSDRLRKVQRKYMQVMEEFDKWCSAHGQRVGAKGAPGDLGCVAASPQTPAPGAAAWKPEDRK